MRDRREPDLPMRGCSPQTQAVYLARVRAFVRSCQRPPEQLPRADIHRCPLHLTRERRVAWAVFNQAVAGRRCFHGVTLQKGWDIARLPYHQKSGRRLPVGLRQAAVRARLPAVRHGKPRALRLTV